MHIYERVYTYAANIFWKDIRKAIVVNLREALGNSSLYTILPHLHF